MEDHVDGHLLMTLMVVRDMVLKDQLIVSITAASATRPVVVQAFTRASITAPVAISSVVLPAFMAAMVTAARTIRQVTIRAFHPAPVTISPGMVSVFMKGSMDHAEGTRADQTMMDSVLGAEVLASL